MYNKTQKDMLEYIHEGLPSQREFLRDQFFATHLEKYKFSKKRRKQVIQEFDDYLELFTTSYKEDEFAKLRVKITLLEKEVDILQKKLNSIKEKYEDLKQVKNLLSFFTLSLTNARKRCTNTIISIPHNARGH